jgi:hypothetical protein
MSETENKNISYCRACGKALAAEEQRVAQGIIYCEQHVPTATAPPADSPWTAPQPPRAASSIGASPGLAFVLGLIPGVGAIYNAQYAKGLVHVIIFGLLISIVNSDAAGGLEPLIGMMIPIWIFYMAFDAYHTARKRLAGETVDEFSSLFPLQGGGSNAYVGPAILIGVGILFLLNNLNLLKLYHLLRYWPVLLILLGVYMLIMRVKGAPGESRVQQEVGDER